MRPTGRPYARPIRLNASTKSLNADTRHGSDWRGSVYLSLFSVCGSNHGVPLEFSSRLSMVGCLHTNCRLTFNLSACLVASDTAAGLSSFSLSVHVSTFLRPFAPSPLRDFAATMDALTPADPALRSSPSNMNTVSIYQQVSRIMCLTFRSLRLQPPPQALDADFSRYPSSRRASGRRRSRLRHSMAGSPDTLGRIGFRYPTDWSFTSCCSPPRLTATQLQSVTGCSVDLERTRTSPIHTLSDARAQASSLRLRRI